MESRYWIGGISAILVLAFIAKMFWSLRGSDKDRGIEADGDWIL